MDTLTAITQPDGRSYVLPPDLMRQPMFWHHAPGMSQG